MRTGGNIAVLELTSTGGALSRVAAALAGDGLQQDTIASSIFELLDADGQVKTNSRSPLRRLVGRLYDAALETRGAPPNLESSLHDLIGATIADLDSTTLTVQTQAEELLEVTARAVGDDSNIATVATQLQLLRDSFPTTRFGAYFRARVDEILNAEEPDLGSSVATGGLAGSCFLLLVELGFELEPAQIGSTTELSIGTETATETRRFVDFTHDASLSDEQMRQAGTMAVLSMPADSIGVHTHRPKEGRVLVQVNSDFGGLDRTFVEVQDLVPIINPEPGRTIYLTGCYSAEIAAEFRDLTQAGEVYAVDGYTIIYWDLDSFEAFDRLDEALSNYGERPSPEEVAAAVAQVQTQVPRFAELSFTITSDEFSYYELDGVLLKARSLFEAFEDPDTAMLFGSIISGLRSTGIDIGDIPDLLATQDITPEQIIAEHGEPALADDISANDLVRDGLAQLADLDEFSHIARTGIVNFIDRNFEIWTSDEFRGTASGDNADTLARLLSNDAFIGLMGCLPPLSIYSEFGDRFEPSISQLLVLPQYLESGVNEAYAVINENRPLGPMVLFDQENPGGVGVQLADPFQGQTHTSFGFDSPRVGQARTPLEPNFETITSSGWRNPSKGPG